MKLDKSDALMLHSILFAYVNSDGVKLEFIDVDHIASLQERMQDFITQHLDHDDVDVEDETDNDDHDHDEDDEDDEDDVDVEDDEDDEDDEDPIDVFVSPNDISDLSPLKVTSPDGSTISLEFEDVGESDFVDALLDEGTVIIQTVSKIVVSNNCVALFDGEEWHEFKFEKLSKSWKRFFPAAQIVGFSSGEKEE
jgi:hypothetical protein